jgi:hypothetical protein
LLIFGRRSQSPSSGDQKKTAVVVEAPCPENNERLSETSWTSHISSLWKDGEGKELDSLSDPPSEAACAVHLQLLTSLVVLRKNVEHWGQSHDADPDKSWHAFVKLAVVRFTHWFCSVTLSEMESSLAPLGMLAQKIKIYLSKDL